MNVILRSACVSIFCAGAVAGAQPTAPRKTLVQEFRLDPATEDFTSFGSVVINPSGAFVIPQARDFQLLFYDATGKRIGAFGRKGGGPGEFAASFSPPQANLWVGPYADSVWVYDATARRFTIVSPAAKLIRTFNLPTKLTVDDHAGANPQRSLQSFNPMFLYPDGRMLGRASFGVRVPATRSDGSTVLMVKTEPADIAIASREGVILTTIGRGPDSEESMVTAVRAGGLSSTGIGIPLYAYPLQAVANDGSRVAFVTTSTAANNSAIQLTVVRAKGDTALSRRYAFAGTPIPKAVIDSVIDARFKSPPGKPPQFAPDVATELEGKLRDRMPRVYAPLRSVLLGLDDTIWLVLRAVDGANPAVMLDAKGDAIASVILPKRAVLLAGNRQTIWVMQFDDDDLPSLVRYRIQG